MDSKRVDEIRTIMSTRHAYWKLSSGDHQNMIDDLIEYIDDDLKPRLDAQAERIRELKEQLSAKILMGVGQVATVADARARKETATEIERGLTKLPWVLDDFCAGKAVWLEDAVKVCRAHGADV